ncbi:hypothetical protein CRUP_015110 [Coryphaenoides rupestris]|nr:hypothetical protein CRUP_015110 [Coryphaenoides rupestris]
MERCWTPYETSVAASSSCLSVKMRTRLSCKAPARRWTKKGHCLASFRHTKQNSSLQRGQRTFLQPVPSCSTFMPQVGHARMDGQGSTPFTLDSTTVPHVLSNSTSGLTQPWLAQQVVLGAFPFQGFRHCQQKCVRGDGSLGRTTQHHTQHLPVEQDT